MGLFNIDKNKILGTVFKTASSVLGTASRALGSAAKTATKVSKASAGIGKARPKAQPTVQPTARPVTPPPVAPARATETEPPIARPITPGSDRPIKPIAAEDLTPATSADIAMLMAEIEKLKAERDFLLQNQGNATPFGAAAVSANPDTFEKQMAVKAAIDNARAANPDADPEEVRLLAIDSANYPAEDEAAGYPDNYEELRELTPGPIPY